MVPHPILIQMLSSQCKEELLKWVQSFCSESLQIVVLDDITSSRLDFTSGIRRIRAGSLMFVIFINDFTEVIEDYCKLYADDRKFIRVIEDESIAGSLQRDIESLTNFTKKWLMKLNHHLANARSCILVSRM